MINISLKEKLGNELYKEYKKKFNNVKKYAKKGEEEKYQKAIKELKEFKDKLGISKYQKQKKVRQIKQLLATTHKLVVCPKCNTQNIVKKERGILVCRKCKKRSKL